MNFYKLTLSYQGSRYLGWQKQPDGGSVQNELEKSLRTILKKELKTIGSGRTDAGVHALDQVVRLDTLATIDPEALKKGLNSLLPPDVRVLDTVQTTGDFHPILSAEAKEYCYLFKNKSNLSAFEHPFITPVKGNLNWEKMQQAAKAFEGEHNFERYFCRGTDVPSTVRTIFESSIQTYPQQSFWDELSLSSEYSVFKVRGSGFLKQMVRLMMGTIWKCGQGKISVEEVVSSLDPGPGRHLAPVAPPQGLYLTKVFYRES